MGENENSINFILIQHLFLPPFYVVQIKTDMWRWTHVFVERERDGREIKFIMHTSCFCRVEDPRGKFA